MQHTRDVDECSSPGLNVQLEDCNNPLEYFELLITPELANIMRETSRYAEQRLENKPELKIQCTLRHWSNTDREDIQ